VVITESTANVEGRYEIFQDRRRTVSRPWRSLITSARNGRKERQIRVKWYNKQFMTGKSMNERSAVTCLKSTGYLENLGIRRFGTKMVYHWKGSPLISQKTVTVNGW
jgi:hypothetical protein